MRYQSWPCRKIGQGQPRITIWTKLIVLEHAILHTKFQSHRLFGSGVEDFLRFLPYMGMAAILVMWPGLFEKTFVPPSHGDSIWNLDSIDPVVSEEKMFKECGRQTTDGRRTTEAYLSYNLPMTLRLRWAKKRKGNQNQNCLLMLRISQLDMWPMNSGECLLHLGESYI